MNRHDNDTYARFAQRIKRAADADDWAALAAADRDLADVLSELDGRPDLVASARPALLALRAVHGAALQRCVEAGVRAGEHLAELSASRDGWLAYAHDHSLSDGQS
jgi:DNA-binding GntR family transcriptional regulator